MVDDAFGSFVRGVSVHDSYARLISVHGTHNLLIEKNVGFRIAGHGIFL